MKFLACKFTLCKCQKTGTRILIPVHNNRGKCIISYFLRFFKNANKLAPAAAAVADPANNPVPTNTPVFVPSVFLESSGIYKLAHSTE